MSDLVSPAAASQPPTVAVRGEAQLEGPPDLATFIFTAHRTGSTQDGVRSALADASGRVRELLSSFDASVERWSTYGLHVAPVYRRRSEGKVQGYRGSFSTEIVVRDFDALSSIVFGLAPIADAQIDGPNWSLRSDNPLFSEVRLAAIAEARRRAADYAAAFGASIVELVEISDLEGGFPGGWARGAKFGMASAGVEEQSEFDFQPGVQTVSGQVTVRFTMTRPDLSTS